MPSTGFVPQPLSLPPFAPRAAARISLCGKPLHCVPFPCRSLPTARHSLTQSHLPAYIPINHHNLQPMTSRHLVPATLQLFNPSTLQLLNFFSPQLNQIRNSKPARSSRKQIFLSGARQGFGHPFRHHKRTHQPKTQTPHLRLLAAVCALIRLTPTTPKTPQLRTQNAASQNQNPATRQLK